MAGGEMLSFIARRRTDQRQFVGGSRAESSPGTYRRQRSERRHVFLGAPQHARQNIVIDFIAVCPLLPRLTDENLASPPGLHIEGDGITGDGMRALQVPELDELMSQEARVAIRDNQVS